MKPVSYFTAGLISSILMVGMLAPKNSNITEISIAIPHNTLHPSIGLDTVQLDCMAQNIFFEARGESIQGKAMVGMVVLERTYSPHFPGTVCEVVKQAETTASGAIIRDHCQFSWYCDGQPHNIDFDDAGVAKEWDESYQVAKVVMLGHVTSSIDLDGVTHYHSRKVKPFWSKDHNYKLVAKIGNHLFYRWNKALLPRWEPSNQYAMAN